MILVDSNLLLYAKIADYPQHAAARGWWDRALEDQPRIGLPWPTLVSFVRICTNARLFPRPLAPVAAWAQVEEWLSQPAVWIPQPGERHAELLGALISSNGVSGNLVSDAHLAALALEHGLTIFSSDGDFGRFKGLRWENPLAA